MVTQYSTKSELAGLDDAIKFVRWEEYFFEEEVKGLPGNFILKNLGKRVIIKQHNTSEIQLEYNSKRPITRRTRHIHIKYFYKTKTLKNDQGILIVYKPISEMSSKIHTKVL